MKTSTAEIPRIDRTSPTDVAARIAAGHEYASESVTYEAGPIAPGWYGLTRGSARSDLPAGGELVTVTPLAPTLVHMAEEPRVLTLRMAEEYRAATLRMAELAEDINDLVLQMGRVSAHASTRVGTKPCRKPWANGYD